jgi:hypothetical protein
MHSKRSRQPVIPHWLPSTPTTLLQRCFTFAFKLRLVRFERWLRRWTDCDPMDCKQIDWSAAPKHQSFMTVAGPMHQHHFAGTMDRMRVSGTGYIPAFMSMVRITLALFVKACPSDLVVSLHLHYSQVHVFHLQSRRWSSQSNVYVPQNSPPTPSYSMAY